MDHSRKQQHHQHHLGVNKLGKSIRKSPLHQPSFANPRPPPPPPPHHHHQQQQPPPPQPQVYNISKSDFRSIVQQLTGTPSRDPNPNPAPPPSLSQPPPPPRPPQPKAPSMRLQKIRPPPLTPIARPPLAAAPHPYANPNPHPIPNHNPHQNPPFFHRPAPGPSPAGPAWAESPVSAYMRYLESSLLSSDGSRQPQAQPPLPSPGLLPSPQLALIPSPRANAFPPNTPPALLPSPGAQFTVPSPSGFLNLVSPKSPYPLLYPGFQYPPPLTPNFSFSPLAQSGILGPGPGLQPPPPPSPGVLFPPSPSGFLPLLSPRWRDM